MADGGRPETEARLCVYLLGRFELRADGQVLIDRAWHRGKAKALLKLLALQKDRSLLREQVFEALWPDLDAAAAANNLHKALYHLRGVWRSFPCTLDLVATAHNIVQLAPDVWLDTEAFRAGASAARAASSDALLYEEALALYGGDLLPDDRYEEWTEPQREELRALRQRLLMELSGVYHKEGRPSPAAELLEQVLLTEPSHEEAHLALIHLHAASGHRDRALRQYGRCRDALRRDLGVEPSAETEAAVREIRAGVSVTPAVALDRKPGVDGSDPGSGPAIRYATTEDGVSIAFWTLGRGEPLVWMPHAPNSHIQMEWQMPEYRALYERFAGHHMVVKYDSRGTGLSDRHAIDFSPEAQVRDLEAVVDALGMQRFDLFALMHTGPFAVTFAVRHPERLSRLVLWTSYARGLDFYSLPQFDVVASMIERDWPTYSETVASSMLGWADDEVARRLASVVRASSGPAVDQAMVAAMREVDVTALLPAVRAPTLVVHRREIAFMPSAVCTPLAAGIPGARLVILDGSQALPITGDVDGALAPVEAFLREPLATPQAAPPATA